MNDAGPLPYNVAVVLPLSIGAAFTLGGVIGQRIDLTLNRNLHQIDLGKEFLDYYRIPDLSLAVDDELFRPDPGYTLQSLREDWEKPPAKKAEKG